jgi:hypothetical protein
MEMILTLFKQLFTEIANLKFNLHYTNKRHIYIYSKRFSHSANGQGNLYVFVYFLKKKIAKKKVLLFIFKSSIFLQKK